MYHNAKINNISYIKIIFSKIFYDKYDIFQKRDDTKQSRQAFSKACLRVKRLYYKAVGY